MRKVLLLIVLLVVIALALPYGMGMFAQKRLNRLVDHMNAQSPNHEIKIENYQRGYLSSTADFNITFTVPNQQQKKSNYLAGPDKIQELSFVVHYKINHGPLLKTDDGFKLGQAIAHGTVVLDPNVQAKLNAVFKDQKEKPTLKATILITLLGNSVHSAEIPPFTYEAKEIGGTVQWKGLQGHWEIARALNKVSGQVSFAGFSVNSPRVDVQLANILVKFNQHEDPSGLWIGRGDVALPMLKVSENGKEKFLLTDLSFGSKSDIKSKLMSASLESKLGKVAVNDVTYGPAEFNSLLKNLDVATLQQLKQQLTEMNQANVTADQRQMLMMAVLPLLPKLLDKGAEYQIQKFSFQFPEGLMKADGYVKLNKPAPGAENARPSPLAYKNRLEAQFQLDIPVALAKKFMLKTTVRKLRQQEALKAMLAKRIQQQASPVAPPANGQAVAPQQPQQPAFKPMSEQEINTLAEKTVEQQLSMWLSKGLLKQSGDIYQVSISFKQGELTVNGLSPLTAQNTETTTKKVAAAQ